MVNQKEAMDQLNKEKDYEDALVQILAKYYLSCLEEIKGLEEGKRRKIEEMLLIIKTDSSRHSDMFNMLVQMVLENGEDNY
jgi:hypothetical protein